MTSMIARRALVLLLALAGLLAAASPAFAAQQKVDVEGTNWYWASQQRAKPSDVTGGCPEGTPVCPDPAVGLPNPHDPGSLPVMALNGEVEKVSAIQFDLGFVPFQGGKFGKFTFTVVESPAPRDQIQNFNAEGREIQACFIEDVWPASEDGADEMEDAPPYDCTDAPKGKRNDKTDPPTWTFDVTKWAEKWGADPFEANGVMLVPVVKKDGGPTETWQIVLKGPRRDVAETPMNEEEENAKNIQATADFTPNPAPVTTPPPPITPIDTGTGGGFAGGGDFGFTGDTGGTTDVAPPPAAEPAPPVVEEVTEVAQPEPVAEALPTTPGYVWLVIPAGLIALALVRQTVMEPLPGKREDGVVARIRMQNDARRGGPRAAAPGGTAVLAGVGRAFRDSARKLAFWRK